MISESLKINTTLTKLNLGSNEIELNKNIIIREIEERKRKSNNNKKKEK